MVPLSWNDFLLFAVPKLQKHSKQPKSYTRIHFCAVPQALCKRPALSASSASLLLCTPLETMSHLPRCCHFLVHTKRQYQGPHLVVLTMNTSQLRLKRAPDIKARNQLHEFTRALTSHVQSPKMLETPHQVTASTLYIY